jgi:hypothetical protein
MRKCVLLLTLFLLFLGTVLYCVTNISHGLRIVDSSFGLTTNILVFVVRRRTTLYIGYNSFDARIRRGKVAAA